MRYIEVPGEIDSNNQLLLHESLAQIKPQQVKIDIVFRDDEEDYCEPTKAEILESIVNGLREYDRGECKPVEKMWDDIMIQSTGEIDDRGQLILDKSLQDILPQYVDVVIWFIYERESSSANLSTSDETRGECYPVLVKELDQSRTRAYARK